MLLDIEASDFLSLNEVRISKEQLLEIFPEIKEQFSENEISKIYDPAFMVVSREFINEKDQSILGTAAFYYVDRDLTITGNDSIKTQLMRYNENAGVSHKLNPITCFEFKGAELSTECLSENILLKQVIVRNSFTAELIENSSM